MSELRYAVERLLRHYPKTSLNPDALLGLDVLAVRDALTREPEREAAVERLCDSAWSAVATLREEGYERAADDLVEAVAAVRGREEREGG